MDVSHAERIYSSYSGFYDLLFDTILHPGRRRAVEALAIEAGDRILEVGVGTGLSLPLYPEGCRITGIDISLAMLRRAAERAVALGRVDIELKRMSAERLKWPEATFDKVLLPYVISCVDDPGQVVREAHRVCRLDGTVVFVNHFLSRNPIASWCERRLTPLSRRLGFVLDLPVESVVPHGLFRVERVERVNVPRLWSLVVCRRI